MIDFQEAIRNRIRFRLGELGLPVTGKTYTDAGIGATTVRNFLAGMTHSLTVETAEKLAPVLKVSAQWLLYGDTAEIVNLWDRVPLDRRELAKDVLQSFADDKSHGT